MNKESYRLPINITRYLLRIHNCLVINKPPPLETRRERGLTLELGTPYTATAARFVRALVNDNRISYDRLQGTAKKYILQ